jgi:hypothetical protein
MQLRRVLTAVAVSVFGLIGVGCIAIVCCLQIGDPEPTPAVSIVNRTHQHLKVYSLIVTVDPDVPDRPLIAEISPNGTAEASGGPCMGNLLVARARDRTVVARIGPFDYCFKGPWIIRPGKPEP